MSEKKVATEDPPTASQPPVQEVLTTQALNAPAIAEPAKKKKNKKKKNKKKKANAEAAAAASPVDNEKENVSPNAAIADSLDDNEDEEVAEEPPTPVEASHQEPATAAKSPVVADSPVVSVDLPPAIETVPDQEVIDPAQEPVPEALEAADPIEPFHQPHCAVHEATDERVAEPVVEPVVAPVVDPIVPPAVESQIQEEPVDEVEKPAADIFANSDSAPLPWEQPPAATTTEPAPLHDEEGFAQEHQPVVVDEQEIHNENADDPAPAPVTETLASVSDNIDPTIESAPEPVPVTVESTSAPEPVVAPVQTATLPVVEEATAPITDKSLAPVDTETLFGAPVSSEAMPWEADTSKTAEPLPWEEPASDTQHAEPRVDSPEEPKTKAIASKLASLDLDDESLLESGELTETVAPQTVPETAPQSQSSDLFGSEGDDFAAMISQSATPVAASSGSKPVSKVASPKKLAFLEMDDDFLDDDLLEDEPPAPTQKDQKPSSFVQAPSSGPAQRYAPVQPMAQAQSRVVSAYQSQQPSAFQPHNAYAASQAAQSSQHHLDIRKLNENKKKSDAYDFPSAYMPQKPVHKPNRAQSSIQMNQQYQAHQQAPLAAPPHASHQPQNAYAPQPGQASPAASVASSHYAPSASGAARPTPPPASLKKKQSSFFEELPLPPIKPVKTRDSSSSPLASHAQPSYGAPQQFGAGQGRPMAPPKGISRPPSRTPGIGQRAPSIGSVTSPPVVSSPLAQVTNPYAPPSGPSATQLPQNLYAPSQQQGLPPSVPPQGPPQMQASPQMYGAPQLMQNQTTGLGLQQQPQHPGFGMSAPGFAPPSMPSGLSSQQGNSPKPSKYAPATAGTGPPQGHIRKTSISSVVQQPPVSRSPQPQLSHMINPQNPYAPAAMSGQAQPLTQGQIQPSPGLPVQTLPQIQTSSLDVKSPNPNTPSVTPSATRYAPINHRRQASTSAAQYDPFSAHKLQQAADPNRLGVAAGAKGYSVTSPMVSQTPQMHPPSHLGQTQQGYPYPQAQPGFGLQVPQAGQQGYGAPQTSPLLQRQPVTTVPVGVVAPPQQSTYGAQARNASVAAPVNPEQLMSRQFPLFTWGNGAKVAYMIPSYHTPQSVHLVKTEDVLQDATLKAFESVSKKNIATADKFLDTQLEKLVNSPLKGDEILLVQLLKHKLSKTPAVFNMGGAVNYVENHTPAYNENAMTRSKVPMNKRHLVSLISSGQKEDALRLAMNHQNYSLALLISSVISKESWLNMVESYLAHEFKGDQENFLPLLFRVLTGDGDKVIAQLSADPQRKAWAISNWSSIASAVVTNNPPCLTEFLLSFGKFLVDNDKVVAGIILFILADAPVSSFQAPHSVTLTLYLEIYGTILQDKGIAVDLSDVLLDHACYLADYNMLTESQKYLDSAQAAFKISKRTDARFASVAKALSDRLSGAGIEGGWFAKPKLDRVWGTLDKGLNKLISGDEIKPEAKEGALFSKFSPSVSRSSSYLSMANAANAANTSMGSDFQGYRPAGRAGSYAAPGAYSGHESSMRSYTPSAARVPGQPGAVPGFQPPSMAAAKNNSVNSSPQALMGDGVTSSPQGRARYAASLDSMSRRSSFQSHTSGTEEFGKPHNGNHYAPPQARQYQPFQSESSSTSTADEVQSQQPPQLQSAPPMATSLSKAGPPKVGLSKAGPAKPRAARSAVVANSGNLLNELSLQGRPTPPSVTPVSSQPTTPAQKPVVPASQSSVTSPQPQHADIAQSVETSDKVTAGVVDESSFATESTLRNNQSTLMNQMSEPSIAEPSVEEAIEEDGVAAEETAPQIETQDAHAEEAVEPQNVALPDVSKPFVPITPHRFADEADFGTVSQTQSDFGSSSATPYVVPVGTQEHDVPVDLQEQVLPSRQPSEEPQLVPQNPYAPHPQQNSPYAPSPQGAKAGPKKSSKASGRFTPKSYTPSQVDKVTSPPAPIVTEDIDFYAISGYQPTPPPPQPVDEAQEEKKQEEEVPQPNSHPKQQASPVVAQPVPVVQPAVSPVKSFHPQSSSASQSPVNAYKPQPHQQMSSPVNPYQPQGQSRSRAASTSSNNYTPAPGGYTPVQSNFGPYQPGTGGTDSRVSSFGGPSHTFSPQESRFEPMGPSSSGTTVVPQGGYVPPSVKNISYEPPKAHTISSIPETDETYDDFVEDEDSDEDEIDTKKNKKEEKKKEEKSNAHDGAAGGGWFGFLRKGKQQEGPVVHKAKLGEENSFYYDEELKRWVSKNANPEDLKAMAKPAPPPIVKKKPSNIGKPRSDSANEGTGSVPQAGPGVAGPRAAGLPGAPSGGSPSTGPKKSLAGASDLDALLGVGGPSASSTRRKKKAARGYVDVLGTMKDQK